jgi:hypothetical protein
MATDITKIACTFTVSNDSLTATIPTDILEYYIADWNLALSK